jgi:hypothetical protein
MAVNVPLQQTWLKTIPRMNPEPQQERTLFFKTEKESGALGQLGTGRREEGWD